MASYHGYFVPQFYVLFSLAVVPVVRFFWWVRKQRNPTRTHLAMLLSGSFVALLYLILSGLQFSLVIFKWVDELQPLIGRVELLALSIAVVGAVLIVRRLHRREISRIQGFEPIV